MNQIILIPLSEIYSDNEFNCRDKIDPLALKELAKSIVDKGLLQTVVVRELPATLVAKHPGKKWHLVCGYRRFNAFLYLDKQEPGKYSQIPATVVIADDTEALSLNLSENIKRMELNLKEEAKAVKNFLDIGLTQQEVSERVGMSRSWVQTRAQMSDLEPDIQDACVELKLPVPHVTAVWQCKTYAERCELIRKYKNVREKGDKIKSTVEKPRDPDKKLVPKKKDIEDFSQQIADKYGYCILTRLLAWVQGNVTDREMSYEIDEFYKDYLMHKERQAVD